MARTFLRMATDDGSGLDGAAASSHAAAARSASRLNARLRRPMMRGFVALSLPLGIGESGNRGIGGSGNRGIWEIGKSGMLEISAASWADDGSFLQRVLDRGEQRVFVERLAQEARRLRRHAADR